MTLPDHTLTSDLVSALTPTATGSRPAGAFSMPGTFFHFLFRHPVFPSPPPYSRDVRQNKATKTRGESTMK